MHRFKTAVFGTGFVGRVHLEGIRRLGFVHVYAIGESQSREGQASWPKSSMSTRPRPTIARSWTIPPWTRSTSARPTRCTSPWSRDALQAGKHVICEKPLATSVEEAQQLVALARETKLPQLHLPQPALLPHGAADAPHARRGRTGRDPGGAGHLLAGLAALRHRLELAHRFQGQRALALPGRHRLALVRHGRARHRPAHHLAVRRPADVPQDAQAAQRTRSKPSPARRSRPKITRKCPSTPRISAR